MNRTQGEHNAACSNRSLIRSSDSPDTPDTSSVAATLIRPIFSCYGEKPDNNINQHVTYMLIKYITVTAYNAFNCFSSMIMKMLRNNVLIDLILFSMKMNEIDLQTPAMACANNVLPDPGGP